MIFSSITFSDYYSHVSENSIIDSVIEKSQNKGDSVFLIYKLVKLLR